MFRNANLMLGELRLDRLLTTTATIMFLILIKNVSHFGGCVSAANPANPSNNKGHSLFKTESLAAQSEAAIETALSDTHRVAKRMDLEACLDQFEVHKNAIIRTGESQAIGGKYLQGLELDTMEECKRLCCETESCDVYIFEEKNDGYCYLFECGPPENFHCKFTRHANYTSAVLIPGRHSPEVTTTPRPSVPHSSGSAVATTSNISQQEWELTNLKVKPETRDETAESAAAAAVSAAAATSLGNMAQLSSQTEMGFPQKAINAHCGRFQFTCHSGECIAVYNACDGIPQCQDGSDEGPECSGASSSSSGLAAKSNAETANVHILESSKPAVMPRYHTPMLQQTPQQQLQTVQQQHQQQQAVQQQTQSAILSPLINNREDAAAWANRKMVSDNNPQTDAGTSVDLNSRIFSHKGGLQLPTSSNNNNNGGVVAFPNANANPNLSPIYNGATLQTNGGNIYLPQTAEMPGGAYMTPQQIQQQLMLPQGHLVLPGNVNWQPQAPLQQQQQQQPVVASTTVVGAKGGAGILPQGPAYVLNAPQQQQAQPLLGAAPSKTLNEDNAAVHAPSSQAAQPLTPPSGVAVAPPRQQQAGHETNKETAKKPGAETASAEEYEEYEEKSTEPPKKKPRKHKKVKSKAGSVSHELPKPKDPIELALEQQQQHGAAAAVAAPPSPVHEQYKMIHENLALEFRDHDGQSERPGGAMLSLSLGLLITAALAILIGCRMKTVGRRARRLGGKTPYSHEADFLVNGMYL